ncbi:zinc-binding dehydrogenase [Devosia sp.]|uniref:zinc-binding dehydrogenase n=1 Tax=Devosia sp. TaxID=1871048 RepID=UPI003A923B89
MTTGLELKSLITADGILRLSLEPSELPDPAADEVIVRIEAAPLNPTDHYQMTGPADLSTLRQDGNSDSPVLLATVPQAAMPFVARRVGQPRPIGTEGAGTVVAAGREADHLMGQRVALRPGGMFAQYRLAKAADCVPLPEGASSADGAAIFVNPLTVLGFVETMKTEGHTGLVHAAAASNLGQMLLKVCLADNIPLVNIVRKPSQVELLRGLGATHVVNSADPDFEADLVRAIAETGATMGFDPTGGGRLAGQMLAAMEAALTPPDAEHMVYGTDVPKRVYIYGGLEGGPTVLDRRFGFAWDIGGWLLFNFMKRTDAATRASLQQRVLDELTTTFASSYTRVVSLRQVLDPDIFRAFQARATGEKFLVDPTLD